MGLTSCSGTCVETQSDASNCGSCGHACASGQVCSRGNCRANCGPNQTLCNGADCVNLQNDLFLKRLLQRLAVIVRLEAATHHQVMQGVHIGVRGHEIGNHRSIFHDIDPVRQIQDLIEPVRYEYE